MPLSPNLSHAYQQVKAVVRLNKKLYDASKFRDAGFEHYEMYFMDGSCPSSEIMHEFIRVAEGTDGGLAVHCKGKILVST